MCIRDSGLGDLVERTFSDLDIPISDTRTFIHSYEPSTPNRPSSVAGTVLTISRSLGPTSIIAKTQFSIDANRDSFYRVLRSNSYTEWEKILKASDNLASITSPSAARTNLELGTAATQTDTRYNHRSNNLSDIASATPPELISDLVAPRFKPTHATITGQII